MEMFKKVATECAAKEGASSTDLDEVYSKKMPTTTNAKCMHACIGETIGATKNNQISVDGVVALAKLAFDGDAAKLQTAHDIATDCVGVTDGDRCEAAHKLLECSVNAHHTRGLEFGDW